VKALGKQFIKEVKCACVSALEELGMKKRRLGIVTWDLHDDFHGFIGLNTDTRFGDGTMAVNPFVGVRCDRIHRIIAEVDGEPYRQYLPPTMSRFLGHLSGHVPITGIEFTRGESMVPGVAALRRGVIEAGIPYVEENASLEAMAQRIPQDCAWDDAGERLLVTLFLLREMEQMRAETQRRIEEAKSKGINTKRFETFVARLERYISTRG
jgi:hypothetical protein